MKRIDTLFTAGMFFVLALIVAFILWRAPQGGLFCYVDEIRQIGFEDTINFREDSNYRLPATIESYISDLGIDGQTAVKMLEHPDDYYYFLLRYTIKNDFFRCIDYIEMKNDTSNEKLFHSLGLYSIGCRPMIPREETQDTMFVLVSKSIGSVGEAVNAVLLMNPPMIYQINMLSPTEPVKEIRMDFTNAKVVLN